VFSAIWLWLNWNYNITINCFEIFQNDKYDFSFTTLRLPFCLETQKAPLAANKRNKLFPSNSKTWTKVRLDWNYCCVFFLRVTEPQITVHLGYVCNVRNVLVSKQSPWIYKTFLFLSALALLKFPYKHVSRKHRSSTIDENSYSTPWFYISWNGGKRCYNTSWVIIINSLPN
jgi:hypothetical protein